MFTLYALVQCNFGFVPSLQNSDFYIKSASTAFLRVAQYLEQGVYDKVAEYLTLMGRTELLTCVATQNSFGKIRDQAQQVCLQIDIRIDQ